MKELLRRCLRPAATVTLRIRSQPLVTAAGSGCVVIAPHQDDEALGCAGLIATRRADDLPVQVVYVTDGAGSHPGHPHLQPTDIARLRRAEAVRAMGKLQVAEDSLHFLGAPDGTLTRLDSGTFEELAARLASILASLQPTELFIPCRNDTSSEHTGAFQLTVRALKIGGLSPRIFEYPVWARWRPQQLIRLGLTNGKVWRLSFPGSAALKRDTLSTYVSQTEPTPPWSDPVLPRGFIACFEFAEEYFFEH